MPRVKRGVTARARHKKILALAKGYRGRRKNVYRVAKQAVMKAGQYAYRDRRTRKRVFRALWIARINAGARSHGVTYSRFISEDGDKGKVTLRFRGREITHQDIGMRLLERIRDELADVSVVEHMPKLEGRQMIMVLAPKKKS